MKKTPSAPTRLPAWPSKLLRGWSKISLIRNDERGITMALVAIFVLAILTMVAWVLDFGSLLVKKTQLQSMVELAAAAGGQMVVDNMKDHTPDQVQSEPFIAQVKAEVQKYLDKNLPATLVNFDLARDTAISYPVNTITHQVKKNDCGGGDKNIDIVVEARYTYPLLFAGLLNGGAGPIITAKATDSILICP